MAGGDRGARRRWAGRHACPGHLPAGPGKVRGGYQFWNCSDGTESVEGLWAKGPTPDGKGEFEYLANPQPLGEAVEELGEVEPRLHSTPKQPLPLKAS